ncbi:MAG: hypothetical protein ACI9R3_006307 [Verrucomicrobiales bacterium]|jgi:hypothetical protein
MLRFSLPDRFSGREGNIAEWSGFWQPFDEATDANEGFNVPDDFVNRTNTLNVDGTTPVSPFDLDGYNFFDEKPYVWVFNAKDVDAGSEWALYTDSSWVFPSSSPESGPTSHPYRLNNADTVVFGGINDSSSATGSRTFAPEKFSIQTHAVPEPSTAMLICLAAGFATSSRRRRNH